MLIVPLFMLEFNDVTDVVFYHIVMIFLQTDHGTILLHAKLCQD